MSLDTNEIEAVVRSLASLMLEHRTVYGKNSPTFSDALFEAEEIVRMALASDEDKSVLNRQIGELQAKIGRLQSGR